MILLLSACVVIAAAGRRQLPDDSCTANAGYFCHYGARHCVAGGTHSVCLMADNTVTTFGYGLYGALGYDVVPLKDGGAAAGYPHTQLSPKKVAGLERVRSCSVNTEGTLCTLNNSTMRGFGYNAKGMLGLGNVDNWVTRPMTALEAPEGGALEAVRSCAPIAVPTKAPTATTTTVPTTAPSTAPIAVPTGGPLHCATQVKSPSLATLVCLAPAGSDSGVHSSLATLDARSLGRLPQLVLFFPFATLCVMPWATLPSATCVR
jgi:hypothetical protein